jgi:alpha-mannosidase
MAQKKSGVEQIVERWRESVATKKRSIISFEDTIKQKIESLKPWIWSDREPIDTWEIRHFHYTNHSERNWVDKEWHPLRVGETWGGVDMSAMFRCSAKMPQRFKGKKVVFKLYFSGDSLLKINGIPYHGLDPFRDTVPLTPCATGEEAYEFDVEGYIKWHQGETVIKPFESSHFAVEDAALNAAFWDLMAAYFVMISEETLEPAVREFLKEGLTRAVAPIDQNAESFETIKAAALEAQKIVKKEIYETTVFRSTGLLHLCGHSHLDLVYLWPYSEFLRKIGRTHSTTLRLMEEFPDYIFSQSQPLLYKEMKRLYPDMFRQVQERVKEGRWEAIGAFWIEPDCNLISGESFVRQIMLGKRFLKKEFNVEPETAWIPDVFGNAWTMPQILVKSGLKNFVTHKMAIWNDTNKWDKSVFWWQGPDGSRIFATVPPSHFIGTLDPAHMKSHWDDFTAKESVGESLYTYGWGDGGGGPDTLMLECASRYKNFPGLPKTKMTTITKALESMRTKTIAAGSAIPVHNDELYLEEHRGVYTTKGKLKKLNRYCEYLYRKAEIFSSFSNLPYPQEELNEGWEYLLTNQFHDSLPGTHLTSVYEDLLEVYDRVIKTGDSVLSNARNQIISSINTEGEGQALVLFNSQPYSRKSLIKHPLKEQQLCLINNEGKEIPHQFITDLETGKSCLTFSGDNIPPLGYTVYRLVHNQPARDADTPLKVSETSLENDYLRVEINSIGELVSLYDKIDGRECLNEQGGNLFRVFEDVPGQYDAWDIVPFYENYEFPLEQEARIEITEEGPLRSAIKVTRNILSSRLVQKIVLARDAKRVDFETWIDWKENHKMLKTRFYTNIVSRFATYDIPYGNIERSCYANNSYDEAKFEVSAHTWMDMSQGDYGISLLNDCKYGHQAKENMIGLTLLRSPKDPDPQSDMEKHFFTYSLYPHMGDWRKAETHREALALNDPIDVMPADNRKGDQPAHHSFMNIEAPGVTLEAIKKAEDSDDIIIRIVERHGCRIKGKICFDRPLKRVAECDLMEHNNEPCNSEGKVLNFVISPYEIKTFRITF